MSSSSGFTALELKAAFDSVLGTRAVFEKRGRITGSVVRRFVEVAFERIQTTDGTGTSQEKHGVLRYYASEKDVPTSKLGSYLLSSSASVTIVREEESEKYIVRVQGVYRRNKAGGAAALNPTEVQICADTAEIARRWKGAVLFAALPPRIVKALSEAAAFTPETLVREAKRTGKLDHRAGDATGKGRGTRSRKNEHKHDQLALLSSGMSITVDSADVEQPVQTQGRERMEEIRKRRAKQEELRLRNTKEEEDNVMQDDKRKVKGSTEPRMSEEQEEENGTNGKEKLYRGPSAREREEEKARELFRMRRKEAEEAQRQRREMRPEIEGRIDATGAVLDRKSRAGAAEAEKDVLLAPPMRKEGSRSQQPAGPLVLELGLRMGKDERVIFRCASHLLCCAYKQADFEFEAPAVDNSGDNSNARVGFFLPGDPAFSLSAAEQKWMRKQLRLRDIFVEGPPGQDPRRRAPVLAEKAAREAKEWTKALETFYEAISRPSRFLMRVASEVGGRCAAGFALLCCGLRARLVRTSKRKYLPRRTFSNPNPSPQDPHGVVAALALVTLRGRSGVPPRSKAGIFIVAQALIAAVRALSVRSDPTDAHEDEPNDKPKREPRPKRARQGFQQPRLVPKEVFAHYVSFSTSLTTESEISAQSLVARKAAASAAAENTGRREIREATSLCDIHLPSVLCALSFPPKPTLKSTPLYRIDALPPVSELLLSLVFDCFRKHCVLCRPWEIGLRPPGAGDNTRNNVTLLLAKALFPTRGGSAATTSTATAEYSIAARRLVRSLLCQAGKTFRPRREMLAQAREIFAVSRDEFGRDFVSLWARGMGSDTKEETRQDSGRRSIVTGAEAKDIQAQKEKSGGVSHLDGDREIGDVNNRDQKERHGHETFNDEEGDGREQELGDREHTYPHVIETQPEGGNTTILANAESSGLADTIARVDAIWAEAKMRTIANVVGRYAASTSAARSVAPISEDEDYEEEQERCVFAFDSEKDFERELQTGFDTNKTEPHIAIAQTQKRLRELHCLGVQLAAEKERQKRQKPQAIGSANKRDKLLESTEDMLLELLRENIRLRIELNGEERDIWASSKFANDSIK